MMYISKCFIESNTSIVDISRCVKICVALPRTLCQYHGAITHHTRPPYSVHPTNHRNAVRA